jgi:hypothetical protein
MDRWLDPIQIEAWLRNPDKPLKPVVVNAGRQLK